MPQDRPGQSQGAFIPADLRPTVGPDVERSAPLEPGASPDEIQQRLGEALSDAERTYLGLQDASLPSEGWQSVFLRSPEVNSTVLDREAVGIPTAEDVLGVVQLRAREPARRRHRPLGQRRGALIVRDDLEVVPDRYLEKEFPHQAPGEMSPLWQTSSVRKD